MKIEKMLLFDSTAISNLQTRKNRYIDYNTFCKGR